MAAESVASPSKRLSNQNHKCQNILTTPGKISRSPDRDVGQSVQRMVGWTKAKISSSWYHVSAHFTFPFNWFPHPAKTRYRKAALHRELVETSPFEMNLIARPSVRAITLDRGTRNLGTDHVVGTNTTICRIMC